MPGSARVLRYSRGQRRVIRVQVLADTREHAARPAAGGLDLLALAGEAVHVRRRAAEIRDDAREARHRVPYLLDFLQDRLFRAALDDPALVLGDGTERAAAEAAAHDIHREADHLVRRDSRIAVGRVWHPRERHAEYIVHLGGRQRFGRRVQPQFLLPVRLHERSRIAGIGLEVQHAVCVGVQHLVVAHFLVGGQPDHGACAVLLRVGHEAQHVALGLRLVLGLLRCAGRGLLGVDVGAHDRIHATRPVDAGRVDLPPAFRRVLPQECRAADVGDFADGLTARQPVREFDHRPLGVAVEQDVRVGVDQDRAPHLVLPVVVVRDAPERGLDAAQDNRHVAVGFLAALRVDERTAVRSPATYAAGCVGVVVPHFAVRRVAVDHRIHVAGGDAEEQVRPAQHLEGFFRMPVGLGDDADAKPLRFEQAPDDGHAERRVIDVGVARYDDDVARVPAERVHLGTRHRQERRGAVAFRPVFVEVVKGFRRSHSGIVACRARRHCSAGVSDYCAAAAGGGESCSTMISSPSGKPSSPALASSFSRIASSRSGERARIHR